MYNECIKPAKKSSISKLEQIRNECRSSNELVEVTDFKTGNTKLRSIGEVMRSSSSSRKFSSFLRLLIDYLNIETVLETGTSLGINTLYLSESSVSRVITIERSSIISALALKNFERLGKTNINLVNGDLYKILEQEIVHYKPDFYFLDADHRSTSIAFCIDLILKHTPNTKCIVIHDVYWSRDMLEMWNQLVEDPRFNLTIDLFQAGILLVTEDMPKQHFTIRF